MATDFSYNEKTINSSGPMKPSGINQPLDPRTEVKLYADIKLIPNPYVGMIITVLEDETNSNKMTDYKVLSLKADDLGVANSVIDRVQKYSDYLGVSSSGGGTGTGLTSEQAQQLTTAYEHSQSPHINTTDVNNAVSTYVTAHKTELKGDKGDTGADGTTPTLTVGSVTTLAAGSNATVTISENSNVYTLNFGIPKGAKGDVGTGSTDNTFQNKVANFLGDSQTEKNQHKTKIYYDWVKEILGLSKTNNYGIGGTTIAKKNASDNTAMCVRYANMDNNADLICVMGGVNDRWFNNQLGNFGDTDPITFYGGMETLCNGLLTKYPGKTIIFITPTEQNNAACNNANKTGYTATDFANAMKRVCAKYSIPVFDANTCSGIYPINEANGRIYTTDKLHLNNKGHEVIGIKLSKFILNGANVVMINNSEESGGGSTSDTYGNIVVSKSTATIREGDTDTFTVKLDKAPTNSQTVNISVNNTDVTLSNSTLTFTSSNYNQAQEVTINTTEDSDKTNDTCTITLSSNGVADKTVTLTINDVTIDEPSSGGTDLTGKSYKLTFNGNQKGYNHVVFSIAKDEDYVVGGTLKMKFDINNATNFPGTSNVNNVQIYTAASPEVNNTDFNGTCTDMVTHNTTFIDGSASVDFNYTLKATNAAYLKVTYGLKPNSSPASIDISNISVTINGKSKPILAVGAFFVSENCVVSEL